MAKGLRGLKNRLLKLLIPIAGLAAVVGGVSWFGYRAYLHRDELPDLPELEIKGDTKQAGKVERQSGPTFVRPALEKDTQSNLLSGGPETSKEGWAPVKAESMFTLGSLFHLGNGGNLQILTNGNWIVALDGEGEFILEDARTDGGQVHTVTWFMKKGTFRAKPHDYDPTKHWLKIRTAVATIYVDNGEMGIRLGQENSGGQIWLITGKAIIVWNDGRRKILTQKGMDYI